MSTRTTRTPQALYSPPRKTAKRRKCEGHIADRHYIDAGEYVIWCALPPGSEIGNEGWWHAAFCLACAPVSTLPTDQAQHLTHDDADAFEQHLRSRGIGFSRVPAETGYALVTPIPQDHDTGVS